MANFSHVEPIHLYSWWASHISPNNSKWIQENLKGLYSFLLTKLMGRFSQIGSVFTFLARKYAYFSPQEKSSISVPHVFNYCTFVTLILHLVGLFFSNSSKLIISFLFNYKVKLSMHWHSTMDWHNTCIGISHFTEACWLHVWSSLPLLCMLGWHTNEMVRHDRLCFLVLIYELEKQEEKLTGDMRPITRCDAFLRFDVSLSTSNIWFRP